MADTNATSIDLPDGKSFPVKMVDNGDGSFSPAQARMERTGTSGAAGAMSVAPLTNVVKAIAAQAVTAGTPVAAWTPATGKKFRLLGYALSLSVAGSVIIKDNTTEVLRTPTVAAAGSHNSPALGLGILSSTINNALQIDVTASGNVSGYVFGIEE